MCKKTFTFDGMSGLLKWLLHWIHCKDIFYNLLGKGVYVFGSVGLFVCLFVLLNVCDQWLYGIERGFLVIITHDLYLLDYNDSNYTPDRSSGSKYVIWKQVTIEWLINAYNAVYVIQHLYDHQEGYPSCINDNLGDIINLQTLLRTQLVHFWCFFFIL